MLPSQRKLFVILIATCMLILFVLKIRLDFGIGDLCLSIVIIIFIPLILTLLIILDRNFRTIREDTLNLSSEDIEWLIENRPGILADKLFCDNLTTRYRVYFEDHFRVVEAKFNPSKDEITVDVVDDEGNIHQERYPIEDRRKALAAAHKSAIKLSRLNLEKARQLVAS